MKKVKAGFAKVDISPEKPVPGRLGLNHIIRPHHPISAKAAAIENTGGKFLMIVCEIVGLTKSVNKEIRDRIVNAADIGFENIVITGTHTHASPWVWDLQDTEARKHGLEVLDLDWMNKVIEGTANAGINALSAMQEYSIRYGVAETTGIVSNRVSPVTRWSVCADDKIRNAPEGTVDRNVRTLSFHDDNGMPVFIFANLACHPSAYGGGKTTKVSPDFPYIAEKLIAKNYDTDVIVAYWQGCAGNINSGKYVIEGSEEEVITIGTSFGKSILSAIDSSNEMPETRFLFNYKKFTLPVGDFVLSPEENMKRFAQYSEDIKKNGTYTDEEVFYWRKVLKQLDVSILSRGREMEMEFQLFRFYDTDILFVPGEWYVEMYLNLAEKYKDRKLIITTLNNFDLLYVPDKESMPHKDWYGVRTGMRSLGDDSAVELYRTADEILS